MAITQHGYRIILDWTGNQGAGTSHYTAYSRNHKIVSGAKPAIAGSSDPAFRGDPARWNPEELLLASISSCHQLWYLHLCSDAGVSVVSYTDEAEGTMTETANGGGRFTAAMLRPFVRIARGCDIPTALRLHERAHDMCFIANSLNFPVTCEPTITFV